jgi:ParB family chromosome partitioning protein
MESRLWSRTYEFGEVIKMAAQLYEFGTALGAGFDGMFEEGRGYQLAVVAVKDILVEKQIREEMEDEDSTLDDMKGSVQRHGILQTLLLRPISGPIPYKLVAGERRYRGAELAGETEVPALIREMTDSEAEDIQLAENIHRKNLTQIEEAKKIQKDLDELGSVEAVLEKHNKGRAWLSKMLGLLKLSDQARRLITEKVSADLEVIGMVKAVEKVDPLAAEQLVDHLKDTRGKVDARQTAAAVKAQVKLPKEARQPAAAAPAAKPVFAGAKKDGAWPFPTGSDSVGTATSHAGAAAKPASPKPAATTSPQETLDRAYGLIFESGTQPQMFLDTLAAGDRAAVAAWLEEHFAAGLVAKDVARRVMTGLRDGGYATAGAAAFAMLAFLQGTDKGHRQQFQLIDVLKAARV